MTLLQAFKASIEFGYTNDDLFNKILIDKGLTSGATYAQSNRSDIDMCKIDLIVDLLTHPEVKDGSQTIKFDKVALKQAAWRLYRRYPGISTTTAFALGFGADISGENVW